MGPLRHIELLVTSSSRDVPRTDFSLVPYISVNRCTWVRQRKFTGVERSVPLPRLSFSPSLVCRVRTFGRLRLLPWTVTFFWVNRLLARQTSAVMNHCWAPQVLSGTGPVPRLLQPSCPQQEEPRGCEHPVSLPPCTGQLGPCCDWLPTSSAAPRQNTHWKRQALCACKASVPPARGSKPWWGVSGWKPPSIFQQTLGGVTNAKAQDERQGCWNHYLYSIIVQKNLKLRLKETRF